MKANKEEQEQEKERLPASPPATHGDVFYRALSHVSTATAAARSFKD
jgi:hypothetical protein